MRNILIFLIAINFAIGLIFNAYLPFYVDEAYYFIWSKFLASGYLDHPPMVAFSIYLTTIFGNSAFFIRLNAWLCYLITTIIVYKLTKKIYNENSAIVAAAVVALSPAITMGMSLATPDAPLVLFWALTLYFAYNALYDGQSSKDYILTGIFLGLAMDSKYSAVLLAFSLLTFVLFHSPKRFLNYKLYLTPLFALIAFAPVLYWNYTHGFASFNFQLKREILSAQGFNEFWQFFGGQFGLFSPIFALVLIYDIYKYKEWQSKEKFLATMSFVVLLFFFYKSFYGHTELNWGAPAYIGAAILVSRRLIEFKKLLYAGIAICFIASFVIRFPTYFGLEGARNPHQRIFGYAEAAKRLDELKLKNENIMADHLAIASILWYHLDTPVSIPTDTRPSMFDMWGLGKDSKPRDGIYLSRDEKEAELKTKYKNVVLLEKFYAKKDGFKEREFYIYRVGN